MLLRKINSIFTVNTYDLYKYIKERQVHCIIRGVSLCETSLYFQFLTTSNYDRRCKDAQGKVTICKPLTIRIQMAFLRLKIV